MTPATEMAHAMSMALATQLKPLIAEVSRLALQSNSQRSIVDTRGMGRPPAFDGADRAWREWRGKVTAYLTATDALADGSLKWAEVQTCVIAQEQLVFECTKDELVNEDRLHLLNAFNKKLYLVLVDTCKNEPYRIVESAGNGQGLEAWRLLTRRYASRTPGTKRALLANLFSLKPATSPDAFESLLMSMEDMVRRYDAMASTPMSDDIKCAVLVACCPRELQEYLNMSSEDFVYQDLRVKVMTWAERKREQHPKNLTQLEHKNSTGLAPMDVSSAQWTHDEWKHWPDLELHGVHNWGGHTEYSGQWPNQPYAEEELYFASKGGKGKAKGKGKASGNVGMKGYTKGDGKGKGKGYMPSSSKGKGKGAGTFEGECHWCGRWGHPARLCKQKDAYMDAVRRGLNPTSNVEEDHEHAHTAADASGVASLACLEATGGHRDMGSWDLGSVLCTNRYAALADEGFEDTANAYHHEYPVPSACVAPRKSRTLGHWVRKTNLLSVPEVPLCNLESTSRRVDLTIDSGAAEHVVGPSDIPHLPTLPSDVQATYVMANGTRTWNKGEQRVNAVTPTGQKISFKTQVTGVHRPLMSVSRICDGGHRVVFEADGGYIESLTNGERIRIRRDQNVYRLCVDIPGEGFQRQGP